MAVYEYPMANATFQLPKRKSASVKVYGNFQSSTGEVGNIQGIRTGNMLDVHWPTDAAAACMSDVPMLLCIPPPIMVAAQPIRVGHPR